MQFKKPLLIILLSGLAGCATFHRPDNGDTSYLKQANSVAPTKIPTGLETTDMQSYYPIPPVNIGPTGYAYQIPLAPPGSQLAQKQIAQTPVAMPAPARASIVAASSSSGLVLNQNFDQAWSSVARGLRAAGYKIMQQDKSLGAYFILDLVGSGGQLKADTPIYQLRLNPNANTTTVTLLDDKGNAANQNISGRILGALKQQL